MSSHYREYFLHNPPRFITFNYDNYLDRKLEFNLTKRFKLTDYKKPEIIHVYGKTSGSSFDKDSQNMDLIVDKDDIYENSKNISLIRKTPNMNIRLQLNDIIGSAKRVIILGYGFHRPNNILLFGSSGLAELVNNNKVIGTGLNLSSGILNSIHSHAKRPDKFPIKADMDCQALIKSMIPIQLI